MPPAPVEDGPGLRFAIISDVHGNAFAFRAALRLARRRGFDRLVILGDLLTYGCEPLAVLDLTHEAVERDRALLIKGNHDQLYIDLAAGERGYYESLPGWLRETVDWTRAAVGGRDLGAAFPWIDRRASGGLLLAHANPFPYGDWTYLNAPAEVASAARVLQGEGAAVGVFGHTHRASLALLGPDGQLHLSAPAADQRLELPLGPAPGGASLVIANPGSVGQPRDAARASTVLFLERTGQGLGLEYARVCYDVDAHKGGIMTAALSPATKAKLLGYLP